MDSGRRRDLSRRRDLPGAGKSHPQADISQLEALFQREVEEIIGSQVRNMADKPAIGRHQRRGTYIGDTDTPTSSGSDMGYTNGG